MFKLRTDDRIEGTLYAEREDPESYDVGIVRNVDGNVATVHWTRANETYDELVLDFFDGDYRIVRDGKIVFSGFPV